jgi:hypothetical protein
MKILVYHGKHGDDHYLVDTPERLEAAKRRLFKQLDEWGCYEQEEGVTEAREGDYHAICWLLDRHKGYEYEGWDIIETIDPCTN